MSKKSTAPEAPQLTLDPRAFGPLIEFPFNYLAKRRGSHWKLDTEERAMLADLTARVCNKHAGAIGEKWGEEIALVLALGSVVGSRMVADFESAPDDGAELSETVS